MTRWKREDRDKVTRWQGERVKGWRLAVTLGMYVTAVQREEKWQCGRVKIGSRKRLTRLRVWCWAGFMSIVRFPNKMRFSISVLKVESWQLEGGEDRQLDKVSELNARCVPSQEKSRFWNQFASNQNNYGFAAQRKEAWRCGGLNIGSGQRKFTRLIGGCVGAQVGWGEVRGWESELAGVGDCFHWK